MPLSPDEFQIALSRHKAGQIEAARAAYQKILEQDDSHADVWHFLGVSSHQLGRNEEALAQIGRAIALNDKNAAYHANRGLALRGLGRLDEAAAAFERAVTLRPSDAAALFNLGAARLEQNRPQAAQLCLDQARSLGRTDANAYVRLSVAYRKLGRYEDAIAAAQTALELAPDSAPALGALGNAHREAGDLPAARQALERAVETDPNSPAAQNNLGIVLEQMGEPEAARGRYEQALTLDPEFAEAHTNLGNLLKASGDIEAAVAYYEQAVAENPELPAAHVSLAKAHKDRGDHQQAAQHFNRAAALAPNSPLDELRQLALGPTVFRDHDHVAEYRASLSQQLARLRGAGARLDPSRLATSAVEPPLALQFLDGNLRPLKEAYARVFQGVVPREFASGDTGAPQQGAARLGLVVTPGHEMGFLRHFAPLLPQLASDDCRVTLIGGAGGLRYMAGHLNAPAIDLLPLPGRYDQMLAAIRAAALDVLYYWEVGSDSTNYFLPLARLAPVQCASFGIQVTTGIPTVDVYASSQTVEGPAYQDHYSERLLLVDGLLSYQEPLPLPAKFLPRESFDIRPHEHFYACPQQLGKFHPDFDRLLKGILEADPRAAIVVVEDRFGVAAEQLRERLVRTLGKDAKRLRWRPRQSPESYRSLIAAADLLLDPPHFSGMNTTYDALSFGRPVVTLPSEFQRGRYTLGCYRAMQVEDCVAHDEESYVQIAVKLGADRDYRESIVQKLTSARRRLFYDAGAIERNRRLFGKLIEMARTG